MPKTFNVIKTDNAENAQNFKARAELKVSEAASESFKIPLPHTHLPHPHAHTHPYTLSQLATVTCTCHKALKLLAGITHASSCFLPHCRLLKTFAWHAHTHKYSIYNWLCVCVVRLDDRALVSSAQLSISAGTCGVCVMWQQEKKTRQTFSKCCTFLLLTTTQIQRRHTHTQAHSNTQWESGKCSQMN